MSLNHSLNQRLARLLGLSLALLSSSGCAIIRHELFLRMEAQEIANSRLTVLAVVCILALPIGVWAGLLWGTRTLSLKSWWLLLTVECVLMAAFASAKAYFS